jgi:ATP-dependent DNA ligase
MGEDWLHEIKYDGYRTHARIAGGKATLLTRTGLDWSHRYLCLLKTPKSPASSVSGAAVIPS